MCLSKYFYIKYVKNSYNSTVRQIVLQKMGKRFGQFTDTKNTNDQYIHEKIFNMS